MSYPDRRRGLIYMLAACAGGPEGIYFQIIFFHFYFNVFTDFRINKDGSK
jgi:hypothetical protein